MTLFNTMSVAGAYTTALDMARQHDTRLKPVSGAKPPLFSGFSMLFLALFAKRIA